MDSTFSQVERIRERFGNIRIVNHPHQDEEEEPDVIFSLIDNSRLAATSNAFMVVEKPILKMTNIPWEISNDDIREFFYDYEIPTFGIHIPIDRANGKTKNEVFVEFNEFTEMVDALARRHRQLLKSREVFLFRANWIELFKSHFSKATNEWLLTLEEQASLLSICRHYKVHFSRRCAERPFEHVCSILRIAPWQTLSASGIAQLAQILQSATEALLGHLSKQKRVCICVTQELLKQNSSLDLSLAKKLVESARQWGTWTAAQLASIQNLEEQIENFTIFSSTSCCYKLQELYKSLQLPIPEQPS